jgi:hypothetical protein
MVATLEIKEGNTLHLVRVDEIKALELRLSVGGLHPYKVHKLTPEEISEFKTEAIVKELQIHFKRGMSLSIESDPHLGITPEYIEECYKHLKAQLTYNV